MDPLTALGLAANILQLIDFGGRVIRDAQDVYSSASGATEANTSLAIGVDQMKSLSSKLITPDSPDQSEDDKAVSALAIEFRDLSEKMLELLTKFKPKKPKSKFSSLTASAFKATWYEKEKRELEQRLRDCQSRFEIQLVAIMRTESKMNLDRLITFSQADATKISQIQTQVERLHHGITISSLSPAIRQEIQSLLGVPIDTLIQHRILKGLAFSEMYGRFDTVSKAHKETFEWIFSMPSQTEADKDSKEDSNMGPNEKVSAVSGEDTSADSKKSSDAPRREHFLPWLSSGNGIFHVSGKPGSGKSTLMKFLYDHPRTKEELEKWAGTRKLVFANFFFWKPGSALQKSLEGLFRALLHDVLQADPSLIPTVLPEQWQHAKSIPWQVQMDIQFRPHEIRRSFTELINNRNIYKSHCFCFFIDGLDEYEETSYEDYKSMVGIITGWTISAIQDVKLCVSSREFTVFKNAFSEEKRFSLQDLTRGDMQRLIEDRLEISGEGEGKEKLVCAILDKANGVFLWVSLVVKSLREQQENGDQLPALQKALEVLPDELEELYIHLLRSISKVARNKAYQIFSMVKKLSDNHLDVENEGFGRFPDNLDFDFELPLIALSFLDDYERDPEFAMRDSFSASTGIENYRLRLEFARKQLMGHSRGLLEVRTPREVGAFLPSITWIHRSFPEFVESTRFKQLMTSHIRSFDADEAISQLVLAVLRSAPSEEMERRVISCCVYSMLILRFRSQIDHEPYRYLRNLNSAVLDLDPPKSTTNRCGAAQTMTYSSCRAFCGHESHTAYSTSVIELSVFLGMYRYFQLELERGVTLFDSYARPAMLQCIRVSLWAMISNSGHVKIVELILRRVLSPQAKLHPQEECSPNFTLWERFVATLWLSSASRPLSKIQCELIETFLRNGADPLITISCGKSDANEREIRLKGGVQEFYGDETCPIWQHFAKKGGDVSLLEMVEFWDLENKETIRELIMKAQNQVIEDGSASHGQLALAEDKGSEDLVQDLESDSISPMTSREMVEELTMLHSNETKNSRLESSFKGYRNVGFSLLITFLTFIWFQLLS